MSARARTNRSLALQELGRLARDAEIAMSDFPKQARSDMSKAAWLTGWQMRDHEIKRQQKA